jgi:hypothetical protein
LRLTLRLGVMLAAGLATLAAIIKLRTVERWSCELPTRGPED